MAEGVTWSFRDVFKKSEGLAFMVCVFAHQRDISIRYKKAFKKLAETKVAAPHTVAVNSSWIRQVGFVVCITYVAQCVSLLSRLPEHLNIFQQMITLCGLLCIGFE